MKTYQGTAPSTSGGWESIANIHESGVLWTVFVKKQNHSDEWLTYKIAANNRVERKANYWLAYNKETGQIGFGRDYILMQQNRPELKKQFDKILKNSA